VKIALDSNRYVDFARGDQSVLEALEAAEEINLPLVVLAELRLRRWIAWAQNERWTKAVSASSRCDGSLPR
jgi:predicted nucleic acid-binding protein